MEAERATRELEQLEQQQSLKQQQAAQEAEMRARAKEAESHFIKETKQEYTDLMKELKANIGSTEKEIAAAIKTATAESYETLPGLKRRLERLQDLAGEAKAAKNISGPVMAEQVKFREEVRLLRAKMAAVCAGGELPGTGNRGTAGNGPTPMPAVPMAFTTMPMEDGPAPPVLFTTRAAEAPQPMAMPMTSLPREGGEEL